MSVSFLIVVKSNQIYSIRQVTDSKVAFTLHIVGLGHKSDVFFHRSQLHVHNLAIVVVNETDDHRVKLQTI